MEPTKPFKLTIKQYSATREVVLHMELTNQNPEPVRAPFSNHTKRLERVGLRIVAQDGALVKPSAVVVVRPRNLAEPGEIPCGGTWNYELKGKLFDGSLEFPGATYLLATGMNYELTVVWQDWISNSVAWQVPSWKA